MTIHYCNRNPWAFCRGLVLVCAGGLMTAASAASIVGDWDVSGSQTVKASGDLVKLLKQNHMSTKNLSHSGRFMDHFTFDATTFVTNGTLPGPWTQSGSQIIAHVDNDDLASQLQAALDNANVPATVTSASNTFTMSVDSKGQLKGTLEVDFELTADDSTNGSFTITSKGSYKGKMGTQNLSRVISVVGRSVAGFAKIAAGNK